MAKPTTVNSSTIPEVLAFEEAKAKLERFVAAYADVFTQIAPYVEDYNDTLEAAGKAVAARGVNCGDFSKMSEAVTYDADKIYEAVGPQKFLDIGSIATRQVFTVDKRRVEIAIANGSIPADIAKEIKKVIPRYSKPKPVQLP